VPDELNTIYTRIHPDDWTRLDERFDGVMTYTDTRVEAVAERAATLERKVDGNHQPGALTRLTRLETWREQHAGDHATGGISRKALIAIASLAIGAAGSVATVISVMRTGHP
jgi:hypothetical protein